MEELPRLSNGKLDLKSLENYTPVEEETFGPQNELEAQLLKIWNEVLPGKSISVKDNFLKIGGNSLSIMRLIGKIFKEFDVRIALSDVFKNLTIEDQAKLVQGLKKDTNVQINKAAVKEAYHLSSAQQRIYYKYTFDNNDTSFNMPMAWELNDEFDFEKTQKAFEGLIKHHEPLRTSFHNSTEGPQQKVHAQVDFKLEKIEAENDGALNKAIASFIRPFALESAPLIRGGVINVDGKARLLVMDIHHIVCDGMSQMNLIQDFKSLYNGVSLKELPLQYKDFAEWEFEYKKTEDYLKHREFWLQSFESELPKLPLIAKDNAADSTAGDNYHFSVNTEAYKPVLDSLKDENVTDFSGLFMLFHLYLSNFSGQTDVVIGTNSSGRIHEETQQMVGMFVKTLPIRYKLDLEVSFKENLKRLHKHILKANSDQLYDLIDIVKNVNEDGSTVELFNAMFVFQNFEKPSENVGELFKHYSLNAETFKYPITLFCHEYDAQMHFRLEYSTAYFNELEIKEFSDGFVRLISEVKEQLDAPIKALLGETKAVEEDVVSFNL